MVKRFRNCVITGTQRPTDMRPDKIEYFEPILTRKISPRVWFGPTPQPVTVTTRIIRFLVGNPFKPSFNDCYWWLFVRFSAEADYTAPELEARQSAKPWIHVFNMALSKIALIQRDWRCSMKRPSGASFICQRLKIWAESETFYSVTIDFWVDQVPTAASDVYSAGVAMAKAVSIRVIFPPAAATWLMMSGLYGNRPTSLILFASQSLPLVYTFWLALIMGLNPDELCCFFAHLFEISQTRAREFDDLHSVGSIGWILRSWSYSFKIPSCKNISNTFRNGQCSCNILQPGRPKWVDRQVIPKPSEIHQSIIINHNSHSAISTIRQRWADRRNLYSRQNLPCRQTSRTLKFKSALVAKPRQMAKAKGLRGLKLPARRKERGNTGNRKSRATWCPRCSYCLHSHCSRSSSHSVESELQFKLSAPTGTSTQYGQPRSFESTKSTKSTESTTLGKPPFVATNGLGQRGTFERRTAEGSSN